MPQDPSAWFNFLAIRGVVAFGLWVPIAWILTRPRFFNWAVGEATPGALGAIRALVCGRLFLMVVWEDLASLAAMPDSLRQWMGMVNIFYVLPIGFERLVDSADALRVLQAGTALMLFLGMIGWRARITVPLGGLGAFVIGGLLRQYSFFWHQDLIALYLIGVLSLTPCGDGWSLDRLIAVARGRPGSAANRPSRAYGWARYACWVALALPYVAAGLSKLRNFGLDWWHSTSMRRMLLTDTLNPMQFDWGVSLDLAYLPDPVFAFLGLSAVAGEVSYGLVLVWPWARRVLPIMMGLMHIGIVFLQNILFLDLIVLQVIFYDLTKARQAIGRRLTARRGSLEVFYDGHCQLCQSTVEILRRLDLFERLRLTDFRHPSISQETLAEQMHVVERGRIFRGFDGYRRLAVVLPMGWLLLPFLWLPGAAWVGSQVYTRIARGRFGAPACGAHCRLAAPHPVPVRADKLDASPSLGWAPLAVAVLGTVLLFSWCFRIERYPFTALQMYTDQKWRSREPIVFSRVLAHRESGEVSKAAFDAAVGFYAINARYRPLINGCFGDARQMEKCRLFLAACGENYNKKASDGRRVMRFEIQKWTCAWEDPKQQQLLDRCVIEL